MLDLKYRKVLSLNEMRIMEYVIYASDTITEIARIKSSKKTVVDLCTKALEEEELKPYSYVESHIWDEWQNLSSEEILPPRESYALNRTPSKVFFHNN